MKTFQHLNTAILRSPLLPRGARPDFREPGSRFRLGLKLASPAFLQKLDATAPEAPSDKQRRSLLRYQLRATGRCTPFGCFAGVTRLSATTSGAPGVILGAPDSHRLHARLDYRRIDELAATTPGARRFRLNSSLYTAGTEYRYAQASGAEYDLSAVKATPYLEQLLPYAAAGLSYNELLEVAVQVCEVPVEEAGDFLSELIAAQVLVDADGPALTGRDPLDSPGTGQDARLSGLQDQLGVEVDEAMLDAVGAALDILIPERTDTDNDVQADMYLQAETAGVPLDRLETIVKEFSALGALAAPYRMPAFETFKQLFTARYDTAAVPLLEALDPDFGIGYGSGTGAWTGPLLDGIPFGAAGSVPSMAPKPVPDRRLQQAPAGALAGAVSYGNLAARAAQSPDTMPAPRPGSPDTMPAPIGTPDTMPAPDTMPGPIVSPDTMPHQPVIIPNPDTMPAPLEPLPQPDTMPTPLRPAQVPPDTMPQPQPASGDTVAAAGRAQLVQRRFLQSVREGAEMIELSDEDLQGLRPASAPAFARSFPLMGSMRNEADGWRFDVDYVGGSTALSLLGRFAAGDAAIGELCETIAQLEAAAEPDVLVAEIVHLPAAALGNVSRRPVFREYELPYLGVSGATPEHQIEAADLMLQMRGGELCLFSRSRGQRVIPRLSTAHNFGNKSLPVYRLLCELQYQGLSQPAHWDWGTFRNEPFLPAVRYKHLQLCRRSWHLAPAKLRGLSVAEFDALRRSLGIPDALRCGPADQQLHFDLRNADELELLLSELRANPALRIEDDSAETGEAFVRDAAGNSFANEIIIPVLNSDYRPAAGFSLVASDAGVRRSFQPGLGLWHYLRLQCGYAAADAMLSEGLQACLDSLFADRIITGWFFVRYHDQSPELRLRFLLREEAGRAALDARFGQWLQVHTGTGAVSRVTVDTYVRELERYGAASIEAVEQIFSADSTCVLQFLDGDVPSESERFLFSAAALASLFDDADLSTDERIAVLEPLAAAFFREHGGTVALQQSLNARYREQREAIAAALEACPEEWQELLAERGVASRPALQRISQGSGGRAALLALLPDLMHMHVNRVFQVGQRRYELLLYHSLLRQYRSIAARDRNAAAAGA